ncbi:MAG: ABC-type transport auxiliary lipoprotein family protein [Magnetovibrio sp.]|nr:ABC-type transport auxiliary lipoprotein family protein [Magnetovibrio sp.]
MNYLFKSSVTLALVLGLSACAAPPPQPEDVYYRLTPRADMKLTAPVLDGIVEVDRFSAAGSPSSRPILYAEDGTPVVTEYHYHFWIEAPPTMLQSALVSYLRSSGIAKQVVTPEMRVRPDYTVQGRLIRLDTVHGTSASGIAHFELALRRERDGKLVVLGEYDTEIPASDDTVKASVAAIDEAVNKVFADFVADIKKQ